MSSNTIETTSTSDPRVSGERAETVVDGVMAGLAACPGATAGDLAARTVFGRSTVSKALVALEASGVVARANGGRDERGRRLADRWRVAEPVSRESVSSGSGLRLGRGELRAVVLAHLGAHRGEAFTAFEMSKVLGRSAGAVANALAALAVTSRVVQTGDKPRRYQLEP